MPKSEQACLKLVKNYDLLFLNLDNDLLFLNLDKNPDYRGGSSRALVTLCDALRGEIYRGRVCCQVVEKVNG